MPARNVEKRGLAASFLWRQRAIGRCLDLSHGQAEMLGNLGISPSQVTQRVDLDSLVSCSIPSHDDVDDYAAEGIAKRQVTLPLNRVELTLYMHPTV